MPPRAIARLKFERGAPPFRGRPVDAEWPVSAWAIQLAELHGTAKALPLVLFEKSRQALHDFRVFLIKVEALGGVAS